MTRRLGRGLMLACLVSLAGCSADLDREQARLCRLVAVALDDQGAPAVLGQSAVPAAAVAAADDLPLPAGEPAIRVDLRPAGEAETSRAYVACAFGAGSERGRLLAVRTERGPLPLPQVVALARAWLTSPDAASADPAPVAGLARAPRLPSHTGYALQQVVGALPSAATYAVLATAYALVYGLIGRINLAFGAFAAIGGTATLLAVLGAARWGDAVALGVALVMALGSSAAHGLAVARLVFRPLHGATGQQGLVATIGLALVLGEYLRLAQGAEAHWIGPILDTPVALARDGSFTVTVTPIALMVSALALVAGGGLALAMRFSGFGRNWRAYRDDPGAAALFGVGRDRLVGQTFAIAAAFAGLAGGITVLTFGEISFAYAQVLGLKALTAAVLGGIGSVPGAFFGGLFIGLVETAWSASFPIVNRDLVTFVILVATLIWRPGGFFGERDLVPRRI